MYSDTIILADVLVLTIFILSRLLSARVRSPLQNIWTNFAWQISIEIYVISGNCKFLTHITQLT